MLNRPKTGITGTPPWFGVIAISGIKKATIGMDGRPGPSSTGFYLKKASTGGTMPTRGDGFTFIKAIGGGPTNEIRANARFTKTTDIMPVATFKGFWNRTGEVTATPPPVTWFQPKPSAAPPAITPARDDSSPDISQKDLGTVLFKNPEPPKTRFLGF
jgi:hypothetical protein